MWFCSQFLDERHGDIVNACKKWKCDVHGARNKKIVDIFLYYMYIARVVPLFVKPVMFVMNRGTHDISVLRESQTVGPRFEERKIEEKRESRLLFCTLA